MGHALVVVLQALLCFSKSRKSFTRCLKILRVNLRVRPHDLSRGMHVEISAEYTNWNESTRTISHLHAQS